MATQPTDRKATTLIIAGRAGSNTYIDHIQHTVSISPLHEKSNLIF